MLFTLNIFQRLDNELDLVGSQQRDLEEILKLLENSLEQQPHITDSHHADAERRRM